MIPDWLGTLLTVLAAVVVCGLFILLELSDTEGD